MTMNSGSGDCSADINKNQNKKTINQSISN